MAKVKKNCETHTHSRTLHPFLCYTEAKLQQPQAKKKKRNINNHGDKLAAFAKKKKKNV